MKKTYLGVIFSVSVSLLASVNCFGGMFAVDMRELVEAEQEHFALASNKTAQCNVVKTAIYIFKSMVEQQPAMMKLSSSSSVKWNWHAKFFNPILIDFTKVCATGFKKTDMALVAAIRAVIEDAQGVRDLFVNAPQASGEAGDAAELWFERMLKVSGLNMTTKKAGIFSFDPDDDDEDEIDIDEIDIDDFNNTEEAIKKLAKTLRSIKKTFYTLKTGKSKKQAMIDEINAKLREMETCARIIKSVIKRNKTFDAVFLKKLQKKYAKLKADLEACDQKLDAFLDGESFDDEEDEDEDDEEDDD